MKAVTPYFDLLPSVCENIPTLIIICNLNFYDDMYVSVVGILKDNVLVTVL